jgi:hypothetical protein
MTSCINPYNKCTPCGLSEHCTNDTSCPEQCTCKQAIILKNPKALTPYYITHKHWTWGTDPQEPIVVPDMAFKQPQLPSHGPVPTYQCAKKNPTHAEGKKGQQDTIPSRFTCPTATKAGASATPLSAEKSDTHSTTKPQEEQGNPTTDAQTANKPTACQHPQPPPDNPQ